MFKAHIRPRLGTFAVLCLLVATLTHGLQARSSSADTEYLVKAALIVKITKFVQWPATAFENKEAPFVFGILGKDPFGPQLDEMLDGQTIGGRKVKVERFKRIEDLTTSSHVLFVTKGETGRLSKVLQTMVDRPVLLVGEKTRFAHNGGIINFKASRRSRVQFEVNPTAASKRELEINPELLKLGEEVP